MRCQRAAKDIESDESVQLLMAQYVSAKMEFGTEEFWTLFENAVGKDNVPSRAGKPALFVFTPDGKVVFAGCNGLSGIKVDEDFKKTLVKGISQTGRIARPPLEIPDADEFEKKLRKLAVQKKTLDAGKLISATYQSHTPTSGPYSDAELKKLSEMANIALRPPSLGKKIDKRIVRVFDKAQKQMTTIVKSVKRGKTTADEGAVALEKIQQAFSGFSGAQEGFAATWKQLEEVSDTEGLQARAKKLIAEETVEDTDTEKSDSN